MDYSIEFLAGNLEEQVAHLKMLSQLLAQSYTYISQTEFGCMMHNILLGVRRVEDAIELIVEKQRRTIISVTSFKPHNLIQSIGHILSDINTSQSFDVENREAEDKTDWNALIDLENNSSPFTIGDRYDEYNDTRRFMMSSIRRHYYETIEKIKQINSQLTDLVELSKQIETNQKTQRDLYNQMQDDYRDSEWSLDRVSFIEQVKEEIQIGIEEGKDKLTVLKTELRKIKSEHLNSYMPAPIKSLYNTVVNQKRLPYEVLVRNRNKLSEDDIFDYFSFLFRYSTLKEHIESIPLLEPMRGAYEKLFTCRAAKEYVDLLSPVLLLYGGIEEKSHFAILLMVMKDLGLSPKENSPYVQMKNYANEINTSDEAIRFGKDHTIFSKIFSCLGNMPFCEIEYETLGDTKFNQDKMVEYQDVYGRCFAILNQRGLRMPKELETASYLKNPQKLVNLANAMESFSKEQLIRIKFLRLVLRKETLVFG